MLRTIFVGQALEVGGAGKCLFFQSGVGRFGFSGRRGFFLSLTIFWGGGGGAELGFLGTALCCSAAMVSWTLASTWASDLRL